MSQIGAKNKQMVELLQANQEDADKADGGNHAAGVRHRKVMQQVKVLTQESRNDVTDTWADKKTQK